MTFTPGPWSRSDGWASTLSVVDHENIYGAPPAGVVAKVVRASQDGIYSKEKEANARLVEAAPELYLALRKLANEVAASLGIAETEIRRAIGNTNVACLMGRTDEARALLARIDGAA